MALSLDKLIGSYKQIVSMLKTNSVTTVAGVPFTLIDRAGYPVAGALNGPADTTNGAVPTDATTGFPNIESPQGNNKLYISRVEVAAPVAMSIALYDLLFWVGPTTIPTASNTTVDLTGGANYAANATAIAARLPYMADGTTKDYSQVIPSCWMQVAGGNQAHSVVINYVDQAGNADGVTPSTTTQSMVINRMLNFGLASGDYGIRQMRGYVANFATSATGAILPCLLRPLGRYRTQGGLSQIFGPDYTGLPQIFGDSALLMVCIADSTSSSTPAVTVEIAHMDPSA